MPGSLRALPLLFVIHLAPSHADAQSLWPDSLIGQGELGAEWVRPTFATSDDAYSSARGIWMLSGRLRASDRINLVAAGARIVATSGNGGSMLGNPYVGVEFLKPDRTPELSLGVRLLAADNAFPTTQATGFYGDFDRFESVITRAFIVTAAGYHEPFHSENGAFARIRFGATFYHPTGGGVGGENEMYLNYGLRIGRETPAVRVSAEVTGRWLLSANDASFAEATVHQGAVTASFLSGAVRPYVGFRIPIDEDLKPVLDHALIVGVTMGIR